MEIYFVVLQLPGDWELKFTEGRHSPECFWVRAADSINSGNSKIVSIRTDTGISEELRAHVQHCNGFETYVLFYLMLEDGEINDKKIIMKKASDLLKVANYETVIDSGEHFQLVTADYMDNTDLPGNYNYGLIPLSA